MSNLARSGQDLDTRPASGPAADQDRSGRPNRWQESVPTLVNDRAKVRVCVIDDDESMLSAVQRILQSHGYETLGLTGALGTTVQVRKFQPDIILLDLNLPFIRGPELLKLLQQHLKCQPLVILFSGLPPEQLEALAQELDADDFFYKGNGLHRLLGRIHLHAFELNRTKMKGKKEEGQ